MGGLRRRTYRRGRLALVLPLLLALIPTAARAADDPAEQRREVRARQAQVASQIDALQADAADVEAALALVAADVQAQQQAVADARRALAAAEAEIAQAQAGAQEATARIADVQAAVEDQVVGAYVQGAPSPVLELFDQAAATPSAEVLVGLQARRAQDMIDQLAAARQDLGSWQARATEARAAADAHRADEESRLATLATSLDRQQALADQVDDRLDASLGEAASLEQLDATLSAEIRRREEALARQLAAQAAARAQQAAASRAGSGSSGSGSSGSQTSGPISLTTVRGITVASSLAPNLEALLEAAAADGIVLGGGGYRDSSAQIATRRANCGSSDYAIYEMPSSQCHPPTARPGRSMHEQGLAVDFTYNGSVIPNHSSPAFQWLAANAGRYGLRNMPSEPWHWSTNGN